MVITLILILVVLVLILLSVAFLTLFERHLLSASQVRLGPNKVSFIGILQPVLDGVKLLSNRTNFVLSYYSLLYLLSPLLTFLLMFIEWGSLPFYYSFFTLKIALFFFGCVIAGFVYTTLLSGLFSSCSYSSLGAIRSSASLISYEVCFLLFIFLLLLLESELVLFGSFSLIKIFLLAPWLLGVLAEVHRIPFDFAEGESELVSGFNTEYGSFSFVLLFLSEYGSLLFFSFLTSFLFFGSSFIVAAMVLFFLVAIRSVLPRFRYDKLIELFWFILLPLSISLIYIAL